MSRTDRNRRSRCSIGRSTNGKRRHKRAQQISRDSNNRCPQPGSCRSTITAESFAEENRSLSGEPKTTQILEATGSGKQLLIGK